MHDGLKTASSSGWDWPPPAPPPRRRHYHVLAYLFALVVVAAAVLAGVEVYGVIRGTTSTPTYTAPASPLAAKVDPGLVDVTATLDYGQAISAGTGMVLTPSGRVITNNHVIEGATAITVTDVGNHRSYRATVVGYDQAQDIAVLQLAAASGLETVTLGTSSPVTVGEKVLALGNAQGRGGTPAAAAGTVTALNQSITATDQAEGISEQLTGLIQTDVPLQQGDSGGPLVNPAGQVIGMNTAASSQFEIASMATQAFAIPVGQAVSVTAAIVAGRASSAIHIGATAFLGVQPAPYAVLVPGHPAETGAGILGVVAGTAAAKAGLAPGDVIVSIGGHAVTSPMSLRSVMNGYHPGEVASVDWVDELGQAHTATTVFTTGPAG